MPEFIQTIPILRLFDLELTKNFYIGFLGFKIDWEHRFDEKAPIYMQVSRGNLTLHLSGHHGDCCPGSTLFVWMNGIEDFHREINSKGYGFNRPGLEKTFYGSLSVEVIDPSGNKIRFNQRIESEKK